MTHTRRLRSSQTAAGGARRALPPSAWRRGRGRPRAQPAPAEVTRARRRRRKVRAGAAGRGREGLGARGSPGHSGAARGTPSHPFPALLGQLPSSGRPGEPAGRWSRPPRRAALSRARGRGPRRAGPGRAGSPAAGSGRGKGPGSPSLGLAVPGSSRLRCAAAV